MTYENKIKAVAAGVTATLFASVIALTITYRSNSLLTEDLKGEKVRTESLTAEKSSLKKEIERLKMELSGFDTRNKDLERAIKEAQYKVAEREASINRLTNEKADAARKFKKELDAIKKIREDLVAQLENMKKTNTKLEAEVNELNRTIASLRRENESLYARIAEKPMMAYNFRVEAVKKRKDRLTVKAKRINKINISFDVNNPKNLSGNVYVKVRSDKAGELEGETLMAFEESLELNDESLVASTEPFILLGADDYKRFNVAFDPKDKLAEGIYHIMVYNGNNYLGTAQFRIRK